MVIRNKNYAELLTAVRELTLDFGPAEGFVVRKIPSGFAFSKSDTMVVIDADSFAVSDPAVLKDYHVTAKLLMKGAEVDYLPDFVPMDYTTNLINFSFSPVNMQAAGGVRVSRKNYFSDEMVQEVMEDFFNAYRPPMYFDNLPDQMVSEVVNSLDYMDTRRMAYWVAYWLIDKKRMWFANASVMMKKNTVVSTSGASGGNADGCAGNGSLTNVERTTTVKIGDSFTVTESTSKDDTVLTGFTSLWGDKYDFLTKFQLYLRDRYEKLFGDYSLRDNVMISTTVGISRDWEPSAYFSTLRLSPFARDLIS